MIDINKEKYSLMCKNDKLENWFFKNKIYNLRPGLFPLRNVNCGSC